MVQDEWLREKKNRNLGLYTSLSHPFLILSRINRREMRRIGEFRSGNESLASVSQPRRFVNDASRSWQIMHTAVSFSTLSANGTSSRILPNGFRMKSPSNAATITTFRRFAISWANSTMSGNCWAKTLHYISTHELSFVDSYHRVFFDLFADVVELLGGNGGEQLFVVGRELFCVVALVLRILDDEAVVPGNLESLEPPHELGALPGEHGAENHLREKRTGSKENHGLQRWRPKKKKGWRVEEATLVPLDRSLLTLSENPHLQPPKNDPFSNEMQLGIPLVNWGMNLSNHKPGWRVLALHFFVR